MNSYKSIWCAALIALSIVTLGFNIKGGIDNFANKDRKVSVKGLAEKEVDADKVTWPIVSKELGNDLPELYRRLGDTQSKIKHFLTANGVKPEEISVNAPSVIDLNADQYSNNQRTYRYNITSVITVTSRNVKLVRSIIARQGELLKRGRSHRRWRLRKPSEVRVRIVQGDEAEDDGGGDSKRREDGCAVCGELKEPTQQDCLSRPRTVLH